MSEQRRRPFKVRAFSMYWSDYVGASFATRRRAEERAVLYVQAGLLKVQVWEVDERGAVIGQPEPWR